MARSREQRKELVSKIRESGVLPPEVSMERAVTAVMCTLTAHLNRGEAVNLLRSLPEEVSGLFQFCATHRGEHGFRFGAEQFFRIVAEHLDITDDQAEDLSRLVFRAVQEWLPEKQSQDVASELPKELKQVWRAA